MKNHILSIVVSGALVLLAAGCGTTKTTENLLSAAGFKTIPANTAARQAHLQNLPENTVTRVEKNGTTYYVCPDKKNQFLYVGREPQYQEYQKLRLENQMAEAQLQAAAWGPGWDAWGPLGFGWGPY